MKILLTGATGFIGATFLRQAVSHGHEVAALIRPGRSVPLMPDRDASVVWIRGSLEAPPWHEIETFAPRCCMHTAWITTPGAYLDAPENRLYEQWSLGFLQQLGRLGAEHMFVLGTCIEYQASCHPLVEDQTPVAPTTTYARCKAALHEGLQAAAAKAGWSLCWGRVFYPYGVGEHPARLCSSIIAELRQGRKFALKTPMSTKDYIYIEDLAEAMLTVIESRHEGTINLGTGVGVTVREIAATLAQLLDRPQLVEEATAPAFDPWGYVVADSARLRGLGWKPRHPLAAGLQKMITAG